MRSTFLQSLEEEKNRKIPKQRKKRRSVFDGTFFNNMLTNNFMTGATLSPTVEEGEGEDEAGEGEGGDEVSRPDFDNSDRLREWEQMSLNSEADMKPPKGSTHRKGYSSRGKGDLSRGLSSLDDVIEVEMTPIASNGGGSGKGKDKAGEGDGGSGDKGKGKGKVKEDRKTS